jgi:hypothetical protein
MPYKPLKGITLEDQHRNRCPTVSLPLKAPTVLPQSGTTSQPHVRYSRGSLVGVAVT